MKELTFHSELKYRGILSNLVFGFDNIFLLYNDIHQEQIFIFKQGAVLNRLWQLFHIPDKTFKKMQFLQKNTRQTHWRDC